MGHLSRFQKTDRKIENLFFSSVDGYSEHIFRRKSEHSGHAAKTWGRAYRIDNNQQNQFKKLTWF